MPPFDAPSLHNLAPKELDEIVDDLELIKERAVIYFVVDPHEIAEFCFPIKPDELRQPSIDTIADDQAAFNEIFYSRRPKPILLPDYVEELEGVLHSFDKKVAIAYSRAEIIQELITAGGLKELLDGDEISKEDIAEDYFNILLAVARGVFSVGVQRFREVFQTHLLRGTIETKDEEDQKTVDAICSAYKETSLVNAIYREKKKDLKGLADSPVVKERRTRSLLVDAKAIDRTLWLNKAFEFAHQKQKLKRRHVLLYLSSAFRTKRIFELKEVRDSLPVILNKPFPVWRRRRQIFAYVVHKSDNSNKQLALDETIDNLKKVKNVLTEVRRLERTLTFQCHNCVLKSTSKDTPTEHDCTLLQFCLDVKNVYEEIQQKRKQAHNLGLVDTLADYNRIIEKTKRQPKDKDSFHQYLNIFADVCRSGIKDIARDRMQQKHRWILIKTEATNLFKEGFTIPYSDKSAFRSKADLITGVDNILPTKPGLKSDTYNDILKTVIDFYKTPSPEQSDLLEKAYNSYLQFDPGPGERDPEQELINCYLYLAFGQRRVESELRAYEYAKQLLATKLNNSDYASMENEYRYVLLWAARRRGKFKEADECARVAITKWQADPRFYHGRSLNTYAWLVNKKQQADCPYDVIDAINDALKAVEFYRSDPVSNCDVIAANYNNLSYFYAWEATRTKNLSNADQHLRRAQEFLKKLKAVSKETKWDPTHPEYFHTEAFLEYQEFILGLTKGDAKEFLLEKLANAQKAIDNAIRLYPEGPDYETLRDSIQSSRRRIRSGEIRVNQ